MEAYNYQFTALRGTQSGREYYVAMCPLKLIPKIFLFDEEEIPAKLRAQRVLNRARVPEIARYLLDNPQGYVFSSITASIDGEVQFKPIANHGYERNAGILTVRTDGFNQNKLRVCTFTRSVLLPTRPRETQ